MSDVSHVNKLNIVTDGKSLENEPKNTLLSVRNVKVTHFGQGVGLKCGLYEIRRWGGGGIWLVRMCYLVEYTTKKKFLRVKVEVSFLRFLVSRWGPSY